MISNGDFKTKGLYIMRQISEEHKRAYKKFMKLFVKVGIIIMYLMGISHLIIYREPMMFFLWIIGVTLCAFLCHILIKVILR